MTTERGVLRRPVGRAGPRDVGARVLLHRRAARARARRWPPSPARRSTPTSGWPAPRPIRVRPGPRPTPPMAGNDRTHMLRVPDPGRVEDRCIDGSANPYLALAALDRRRPRRHHPQGRPGRPVRAQPARVDRHEAAERGLVAPAHDVVARPRPPRSGRRAPRGTGQDARRRLPRLLRRHQACGGPFVRTPRSRLGSSSDT